MSDVLRQIRSRIEQRRDAIAKGESLLESSRKDPPTNRTATNQVLLEDAMAELRQEFKDLPRPPRPWWSSLHDYLWKSMPVSPPTAGTITGTGLAPATAPAPAASRQVEGAPTVLVDEWVARLCGGGDALFARLLKRRGWSVTEGLAHSSEAVGRTLARGSLPALLLGPDGSTGEGHVEQLAPPRLSEDGILALVVRVSKEACGLGRRSTFVLVWGPTGKPVAAPAHVQVGRPTGVSFRLPSELRPEWLGITRRPWGDSPLRFLVFIEAPGSLDPSGCSATGVLRGQRLGLPDHLRRLFCQDRPGRVYER